MAKVNGPFMSLDASGTFANTLTASKWKGRPYMRLRVTPSNPKTAGQLAVRSILGTLAKAARAVLTSFADVLGVGSLFFVTARNLAPSGQSWISWMQKVMYSLFDTVATLFGTATGTVQGYYNTEAIASGLSSYTDVSGDAHTAGEQLFMLAYFAVNYLGYTGFATGIVTASESEVEDFAEYVHITS